MDLWSFELVLSWCDSMLGRIGCEMCADPSFVNRVGPMVLPTFVVQAVHAGISCMMGGSYMQASWGAFCAYPV